MRLGTSDDEFGDLDALTQYPALRVSPTEAKCLAALQNVLNISPDWSTPSSVMPRRSLV